MVSIYLMANMARTKSRTLGGIWGVAAGGAMGCLFGGWVLIVIGLVAGGIGGLYNRRNVEAWTKLAMDSAEVVIGQAVVAVATLAAGVDLNDDVRKLRHRGNKAWRISSEMR